MSNTQPATAGVPLRFSASRISRYVKCPLQAKFRYLDKLPDPQNSAGSFGKCIHHALEKYNQSGNVEDAVAEFLHVWDHPELIEATPEVWTYGATFDGYRKRGVKMLRDYDEQIKGEKRTVVATEHKFLVPFGDYELFGFVDLVELRQNGNRRELHIVDYKTAKKLPKISALPWDIQFTVYAYAIAQPEFWLGTPETPAIDPGILPWAEAQHLDVRSMLHHLENSRAIDVGVRDDPDYMRLFRVCTEIEKAIKHDVYVPNLSGESCGYCSYKEPCGLPIPVTDSQW